MAAAQRNTSGHEVFGNDPVDQRQVDRKTALTATGLKNYLECLRRRTFGEDLVLNTSQECLVDEFGRLDIGREHHQHVERYFELLTALEREKVHARLERDDPP